MNADGARFCDACGARLEGASDAAAARKTVTVVFTDLAGSTALGERLDPETLRARDVALLRRRRRPPWSATAEPSRSSSATP